MVQPGCMISGLCNRRIKPLRRREVVVCSLDLDVWGKGDRSALCHVNLGQLSRPNLLRLLLLLLQDRLSL